MPTILISGLPGSGTTTLSKLLADELGLEYFSPGQLFKDISKGKAEGQFYFSALNEICKSKGLEIPIFRSENDSKAAINLWETDFGKSKEFHESIDELQNILASKGNIVIDGKLSLRIIKNADLKIWLTSSREERARRASKRDGLSFLQAMEIMASRESREREEWKKIYGFDYFDQVKDADLVFDSTNQTPQEMLEKIRSTVTFKMHL